MSGWKTENDMQISFHSCDEKLHRICQKVGEFLFYGGHQSLLKTKQTIKQVLEVEDTVNQRYPTKTVH